MPRFFIIVVGRWPIRDNNAASMLSHSSLYLSSKSDIFSENVLFMGTNFTSLAFV